MPYIPPIAIRLPFRSARNTIPLLYVFYPERLRFVSSTANRYIISIAIFPSYIAPTY